MSDSVDEVRICRRCKYTYRANKSSTAQTWLCHHPDSLVVDPVTGKNLWTSCYDMRFPNEQCGPEGNLYEEL